MKIVEVEPFVLKVPLKRAITDGTPHITPVEYWGIPGVIITTDAGITGTGITGTQGGEELIYQVIKDHYGKMLIDRDPLAIKQLWEELHWSRLNWIGRAGVVSMAHAAIDIALWDIAAQVAGLPLCKLLGLHKPDGVPVYNTNAGWLNWSVDDLKRDMGALLEKGWTALKMKVGHDDPRIDIERVRAVRKSLGGTFRLMVDANQAWRFPKAREFARGVEDLDITWFEEPCNPDDVRGHSQLAKAIEIPVALGEVVYSKFAFREFIEAGGVHYIQADATRVSGVTEWLDVAGLAACFNLPMVPHHGDHAQVQQHLVAATPNAIMMEYIPWVLDVFEEPAISRAGENLTISDTPGASTRLTKYALNTYRVC